MARAIGMKGGSGGKSLVGRLTAKARSLGAKIGITRAPMVDKRSHLNATEWAKSGRWVHVHSSNVASIAFNSEAKQLFVQFGGSAKGVPQPVYCYFGIDPHKAKSMFNSSSLGRWVWKELRRKKVRFVGPLNRSSS